MYVVSTLKKSFSWIILVVYVLEFFIYFYIDRLHPCREQLQNPAL